MRENQSGTLAIVAVVLLFGLALVVASWAGAGRQASPTVDRSTEQSGPGFKAWKHSPKGMPIGIGSPF